jgi:ethanolamine utilization protein EutA
MDPWATERLELVTVGIDVGSSTSHLLISRVRLRRAGSALSSRFLVVGREALHSSPILLTPYRPDGRIDAGRLSGFVAAIYRAAGIDPAGIDTGAVILTGQALRRANARAIAEALAATSGRFVCAAAGHHLEALLAANGSGAVALSRARRATVLHADIGGGTTKLACIRDGEVLATAALEVGGRLLVSDRAGRVTRLEPAGALAAAVAGVDANPGARPGQADIAQLARVLAGALLAALRGEPPPGGLDLRLTDPLPAVGRRVDLLTVSGGVAEYVHGREQRDFGDLAPALAAELRNALATGRLPWPLADPGEGIRATAIGASQFTAQISGDTITVAGESCLPLRDVPVLVPAADPAGALAVGEVAAAVRRELRLLPDQDGEQPLALAFRWLGPPSHARLRGLAEGVRRAVGGRRGPLVLLVDGDVAGALGAILTRELGFTAPLVCLDGLRLQAFDYVDVGRVLRPAAVVPVVVKSLLFPATAEGAA